MADFIWCEDIGSGYQFWQALFKVIYPEMTVISQNSNSRLSKAVEHICNDENLYYIIIDTVVDNPDVLRELSRLKRSIAGKNNVKLIKIHSFEFSLLSFEFLEQWVFAEDDELRDNRQILLEAKNNLIKLLCHGGTSDELREFKSAYQYQDKMNTEKIAAKLLSEITRNTGFETNKSKVGLCFILSCCEWGDRQEDDICGLDEQRLAADEKMKQIMEHSILKEAFKEVGL